MDRFLKPILLYLLVNVSLVYAASCENGVECISLQKCRHLVAGLQSRTYFLTLVRQLHCGFDDNDGETMVCCPPEFRNSVQQNPNKEQEPINVDGVIRPIQNLLPNMSICGIQNADKIVGGVKTELDEHPWMALIRYRKPRGSGFYCGGVLISSRYVLTAAHCIKGADLPPDWQVSQVRLGEWNISSKTDCSHVECAPPVIDVDVEEIIPHSQYTPLDGHQQFDIALLRLRTEVPFSDFVKPICLPYSDILRGNRFEGTVMEVAGWGKTENTSNSDVKLKVRLPVVDSSECNEIYKKAQREISSTQLCAGGIEGLDSCRGDSGGPLMGQITTLQNWIVVGVVSYGPTPCGTKNWPGVYTRVTSYMDWIENNIKP